MKLSLPALLVLAALNLHGVLAHADEVVAHAGGISGIVSIQHGDGSVTVLAQGSALKTGDIVKTEKESYARLSFTDGSEIALRPDSQIRIQNYSFEDAKPAADTLLLQFFKGGFRALTGLIGKRGNKDAYKVAAPTMTIGIRGTDYIARLCDDSCRAEQAKSAAARPAALEIAARIAAFEGEGSIVANTGQSRSIEAAAPLYVGDLVRTGPSGYAVLVFSDRTRVTVQKDSAFLLSRYHYAAKAPESGNVFLEMIRGGARFVTGLIGKARPKSFRVNTVTATIGVRGTGFDVFCAPKGSSAGSGAPAAAKCDETLYQYTWDGTTELQAGGSTTLLAAGSAALVEEPGRGVQALSAPPQFMLDNNAPRPDQVPVDMDKLFGSDAPTADPGLYVTVLDGRVILSQGAESQELNKGETGYSVNGGAVQRLSSPPPFLQQDPYLRSMKFDPLSCLAQ